MPKANSRKPAVDAQDFLADKGGVKFDLPIDAVLPQVLEYLTQSGRVVLQAPPGPAKPHAPTWPSYSQDGAQEKF